MEFLAIPLALVALAFLIWMAEGGPEKFFAERRKTAEANARAEEAKLERARLKQS